MKIFSWSFGLKLPQIKIKYLCPTRNAYRTQQKVIKGIFKERIYHKHEF